MANRREFLKILGVGTVLSSLPGINLFGYNNKENYLPKIGLQLYTIRKHLDIDFDSAVNKIADVGYYGIETYPLPKNVTLKHASDIFKKLNLEIFSMHYDLPVDSKQMDELLKLSDAYNCDTLVYHGWPQDEKIKNLDPQKEILNWPVVEKYKDLETIKRTVEIYNKTSVSLLKKGIKLGLHNHWWEFEKSPDGIIPFYYLLENLNTEIFFEVDTYWAKTAGQNPAKIISDFGSRAPILHIKDGSAMKGENTYKQVPAGDGTLDFASIVKSGGKNIKWMTVEFDEYDKDIFEGVNKSYNYLVRNKLGKGKI